MKSFLFILVWTLCLLSSCKNSTSEQYAIDWSDNVEKKIIENSTQNPDSLKRNVLHDTLEFIIAFKNGQIIKSLQIKNSTNDTLTKIYWGRDLRFVIARRYCPMLHDGIDETLAYKGKPVGLHKFFYCDGKLKMQGFEYEGRVGIWTTYDSYGNIIQKTDYGNLEKLMKLRDIKYED